MGQLLWPLHLLLIVCLVEVSDAIPIPRQKRDDHLGQINQWRRELTKTTGTSFPDLVWDKALAEKIKKLSDNCDMMGSGETSTRFYLEAGDENGQKLSQLLYSIVLLYAGVKNGEIQLPPEVKISTEQMREMDKSMEELATHPQGTLLALELFNPLQTKIACAPHHCSGIFNIPKLGIPPISYSFNMVCLLGDSSSFPKDNVKGVAKTETYQHHAKSMEVLPETTMPPPMPPQSLALTSSSVFITYFFMLTAALIIVLII